MREGIIEYHQEDRDKRFLDGLVRGIRDANKRTAYPLLVKAYKKFLGRKEIEWFEPERTWWTFRDLRVRINPELGLCIDGEDQLIKLYFKDDKLTRNRVAMVSQLMIESLGSDAGDFNVALLDVRRSKLHVFGKADTSITPLLEGEALAFCRMYQGA